jgi:hypothetical protein
MGTHVARSSCFVLILALCAAVGIAGAADSKGVDVSLKFNDDVTAADTGLPAYPGSKPYKDADQSSSGANLGFSAPSIGIKIVGTNLETADPTEKVATFYWRALSKYGNVLDCSSATADGQRNKSQTEKSDELVCDSGDSVSRNIVYKVGSKKNQRIVAIKPHGSGARFSLMHINIRE